MPAPTACPSPPPTWPISPRAPELKRALVEAWPELSPWERPFASVVDEAGASNMIVRYTGMGLAHVNDATVLSGLVARYHHAIQQIWESRTYQVAEGLLVGLYPAALASEELAQATRAWLAANTSAVPALRRIVVEHLAGVERALAAQERDA